MWTLIFAALLQLAYLPDRKREYVIEDDVASLDSEFSVEGRTDLSSLDESIKFDKKNRMRGMLGWFKLKVSDFITLFFLVRRRKYLFLSCDILSLSQNKLEEGILNFLGIYCAILSCVIV